MTTGIKTSDGRILMFSTGYNSEGDLELVLYNCDDDSYKPTSVIIVSKIENFDTEEEYHISLRNESMKREQLVKVLTTDPDLTKLSQKEASDDESSE